VCVFDIPVEASLTLLQVLYVAEDPDYNRDLLCFSRNIVPEFSKTDADDFFLLVPRQLETAAKVRNLKTRTDLTRIEV